MRIRPTNPHAQSKDPCTPARASVISGSSPEIAGRWESSKRDTARGIQPFKKRKVGRLKIDFERSKVSYGSTHLVSQKRR